MRIKCWLLRVSHALAAHGTLRLSVGFFHSYPSQTFIRIYMLLRTALVHHPAQYRIALTQYCGNFNEVELPAAPATRNETARRFIPLLPLALLGKRKAKPMTDLDLNDVRMFVAIAQAGTLTAAAKQMQLPTSTVSRALTRLEKHLSVLLVQRSPRGLSMTDSGKEYLQSCRRALQTLRMASVAGRPPIEPKRTHQGRLSCHHGP